ncbi:MAG: VTT domain-containing protein [Paenibacillus sp.]|nr:VTT domain-containing protein [Paenibacillus sp.]
MFILVGRMSPFIPAAFINGYVGLLRISFFTFFAATMIGKVPVMLVFVYAGRSLYSGSFLWIPILLIYAVLLIIVYIIYKRFFLKTSDNIESQY